MDAEIHADEAAHWDVLHGFYETKRINHSRAYSDGFGCPNQAESYFSRLRRAVVGQHHHVSPQYLYQYANGGRVARGSQPPEQRDTVQYGSGASLHSPVSRAWKGYWQRAV